MEMEIEFCGFETIRNVAELLNDTESANGLSSGASEGFR
jgi:hypothetical protein